MSDFDLRERVTAYLREQFDPYIEGEGWDFTAEEWRKVALEVIDLVRASPRALDGNGGAPRG